MAEGLNVGELKKWQAVLLVLALTASVVSAWITLRGRGPKIPDSVMLVDVTNGDLYRASTKRALMFPIRHPDTNEAVLWPVHRAESGEWLISERYIPYLSSESSKPVSESVVERSSGRILSSRDTRRRVDVYGRD